MYAGKSNSHVIHLCWLAAFYSDLCCVSLFCSHLHGFYNVLHMVTAFLHDFYMITYVL